MNSLKSRVEKLEQHQFASRSGHSAQFDYDAGTIYCGMLYLDATMYPSYDRVEPTEVYGRGKELHEKRYGPIVPAHLDSHLKRSTLASIAFEFVFDREPRVCDILRFELNVGYRMRDGSKTPALDRNRSGGESNAK